MKSIGPQAPDNNAIRIACITTHGTESMEEVRNLLNTGEGIDCLPLKHLRSSVDSAILEPGSALQQRTWRYGGT
jgi:hypothetical protein